MTGQSAVNLEINANSDGFEIKGGEVDFRTLTVSGGDVAFVGSGSRTYTLPAATTTLVGYSTYTDKGVIIIGTGSGTVATLTVGTNDDILIADSSESSGVKWTSLHNKSTIFSYIEGGF